MKLSCKILYILFVCSILLIGCGKEEENITSNSSNEQENIGNTGNPEEKPTDPPAQANSSVKPEDCVLMINRDMAFDIVAVDIEEPTDRSLSYIGMQFYQGKPVLLYIKPCAQYGSQLMENGEYEKVEWPNPDCGLYAYSQDDTREMLIPGNPLRETLGIEKVIDEYNFYYDYKWYVDDEGCCYCAPVRLADGESYFLKVDKNGCLCYKTTLEPGFIAEDFCCVNGDMYVVVSGKVSREDSNLTTRRLIKFDPDTGILAEKDILKLERKYTTDYFGEGPDGLYMYSKYDNGIIKINPEDGSTSVFISFAGSGYSVPKSNWIFKDFAVMEDGSIGALYLERTRTHPDPTARGLEESIALVEGERIKLTLRAYTIDNWLKEQARRFNLSNGTYWVELEEFSTSGAADLEDYAKQTNVELSAGKGPDILCGNLMEDYIQGLLDKGVLQELSGMMEADGIRIEDYLPAAFSSWGEDGKIYGINLSVYPVGYKIRGDLLGITDKPDIHTLMKALSDFEGEAVYYARNEAGDILRMFMEGSDDLWGTVDWEAGICDFSGELFAQILENAGRYGYKNGRKYTSLVRNMRYNSICQYDSRAELEAEGLIMAGVMFDDGCHGAVDARDTLAINAASPRKEGAWEFLCYLSGEDAQAGAEHVPVNKAALEAWLERELSVRVLPYRTGPILDIIYEEAEAYFSGSKSIKDVTETMRNRVQLYLDEHK